jgi:penicillin-binding protein 1B
MIGVFLLLSALYIFLSLRLVRTIDGRLADGPFAGSADILAAPRAVRIGDPFRFEDAVHELQNSGYTTARGNPIGWYAESPGAIEIEPGPRSMGAGEPTRIEVVGGRISAILSLRDYSNRDAFTFDPLLIANVSQSRERRRLVRFDDIPPVLEHAVLAVEDKRFYSHSGFDFERMLKAAYVDMRDGRKQQGASTLTMQLARSIWLDREKQWRRKFEEVFITWLLEHRLTKHQIFEYYANQIYLGSRGTFRVLGFGEGARAFFGKDISRIDASEAALLAGLARRPSSYNPFQYPARARDRRNLVLGLMPPSRSAWHRPWNLTRATRTSSPSPTASYGRASRRKIATAFACTPRSTATCSAPPKTPSAPACRTLTRNCGSMDRPETFRRDSRR